jgi:hypothetical protein
MAREKETKKGCYMGVGLKVWASETHQRRRSRRRTKSKPPAFFSLVKFLAEKRN